MLKKFRIKNFKSITDSGDCYLTDTITILAGKNESGKTTILEALEDFDTNNKIRESAKPIKSPDSTPEISISFIIEKNDINEILQEIKNPLKVASDVEIELIKTFPDNYSFGQCTSQKEIFSHEEIEKTKKTIMDKWSKIKTIRLGYEALGGDLFDFEFLNFTNEKTLFISFKEAAAPNISHIDENDRDNFLELLTEIETEINDLEKNLSYEINFLEELKKYIPNFILFNSFEDIFPNKIPFTELESSEWIKDLSIISDLKITTIKGADARVKEKHKDDINIKLNNDFEKFWTQDISNLSITWDSENLYFWIKEDGYPYEPTLRSKGRQWHLAFYIKVSARANENVPNIILIDEPGLFLHAKAQEDILGKLEASAQEVQLIFSTHSPYLLEAEKLNRVRLVHRTNELGTHIENKIHALADKETLTPILTAIGLELNAGISALDKVNNVVVEGPSDVYYLNAFKKIFKNNSVNFIFGGGSGNMPIVGTIIHGWGGKVVYLYDNDKGKKDGEKNLINNWLITKDVILTIISKTGSVEDIFSPTDFKKYVLGDENNIYTGANSEYVKTTKQDKVLLAKNFLECCQNGTDVELDKTTNDNIQKLFEEIEKKLSN
ncbi:ATP-binding protein [Candidatus Parcubacteria bacterium]|nr:ATP-binding protein [Patescibacteria group bacterium]MCG2697134.1 ATP-binding protein [Candidatus Parcubacteria bacterium]